MKKNRKNLTGRCAAIALALPLTLVGSAALEAKPLPLPTTTQTAGSQLIADVRQINPTTVEVIYADGKDADWVTNPTAYEIIEKQVTATDILSVNMAKGGGQAITFMPL